MSLSKEKKRWALGWGLVSKTLGFVVLGMLLAQIAVAQVSSSPAFPTVSAPVTIYFDATKGDQGLKGYSGDHLIN